MTNEQMLSPKDVANHLGVNIATVWRWVKIGALKATKSIGNGRLFVAKTDLDEFIKLRKTHKSLIPKKV